MTCLIDLFYKVMEKPDWISLEKLIENKDFDHLFVKKNNTVNVELSDLRAFIFAFVEDAEEYLEEEGLTISCNKKDNGASES